MDDGVPKRFGKLLEHFRLKERRLSKRRRRELPLPSPGWSIGKQERIFARRAGNARRGERIAVKLTFRVPRFGGDGPDETRVTGDQNRCKAGEFEITVMSARALLFISSPKIGLQNANWLVVVPRMRERQRRPAPPRLEERHTSWKTISGKRAARKQLSRQALDALKPWNPLSQELQHDVRR